MDTRNLGMPKNELLFDGRLPKGLDSDWQVCVFMSLGQCDDDYRGKWIDNQYLAGISCNQEWTGTD
jgi:hypothetical protein